MAIDDLASLRSELSDLFSDRDLPATWEEDWVFVKIDDPESAHPPAETIAPTDNIETWITPPDFADQDNRTGSGSTAVLDFGVITVPDFGSIPPPFLEPQIPIMLKTLFHLQIVSRSTCPSTIFTRYGGVSTLSSKAFRDSPASSIGRQGEC